MGFFQTIKNKLGIGGVKVKLQVPGQLSKSDTSVEGKVILTTKSEQEVLDIEVKLVEEYTTGRGDNKKTKEIDLGEVVVPANITIKPGETKEFDFTLHYALAKSNADHLKEKGGAIGALGSAAKFARNEKSEYQIVASADVKSAVLDPNDIKEVRIIE